MKPELASNGATADGYARILRMKLETCHECGAYKQLCRCPIPEGHYHPDNPTFATEGAVRKAMDGDETLTQALDRARVCLEEAHTRLLTTDIVETRHSINEAHRIISDVTYDLPKWWPKTARPKHPGWYYVHTNDHDHNSIRYYDDSSGGSWWLPTNSGMNPNNSFDEWLDLGLRT